MLFLKSGRLEGGSKNEQIKDSFERMDTACLSRDISNLLFDLMSLGCFIKMHHLYSTWKGTDKGRSPDLH